MPKSPKAIRKITAARVKAWRINNPDRSEAIRKRYNEGKAERRVRLGLKEVRGVWARPEHHKYIKEFASKYLVDRHPDYD